MREYFIFLLFLLVSSILWLFATSLTIKIDQIRYKKYEFIGKSIFYWLSTVISFILGYLI